LLADTALTFGSAFPCLPFNPGASAVQSRSIMTLACVVTLQMSLVTTAGLCSLGGLMLTPVHGALPFILLGVCVDDAFVIVTCFNEECGWHLPPEDTAGREKAMARPIEERLSAAMEHAGCSITITSLTNVVAFAVGHSSQLPMLSSFCMFASVGVLAIYGYMLTFFTACLAIDDRRQAAKRQDCCPCFVNEEVALASRGGKLREFFGETYAPFLLQTPVRIAVISVAFIWFCVSLWMSADLDQEWDVSAVVPVSDACLVCLSLSSAASLRFNRLNQLGTCVAMRIAVDELHPG
jgi:predicted RND superfamily exporter protein